jgi:hypothetical protein
MKKKLSIDNIVPGLRIYQDLDDEYKIYVVQYVDEENEKIDLYDIETNDEFEMSFEYYLKGKDIRIMIPDLGVNVRNVILGYPYDAEFAVYEFMTEPEIEYFIKIFMDNYLDKEYIDEYIVSSLDEIKEKLIKVTSNMSHNIRGNGIIKLPKNADIRLISEPDKYNIDKKELAKVKANTTYVLDKMLPLRSHHISRIEVFEYNINTDFDRINFEWVMIYNKVNDKFYIVLLHDGESKVKEHIKDNATSDIVKHYMEKRRRKMR